MNTLLIVLFVSTVIKLIFIFAVIYTLLEDYRKTEKSYKINTAFNDSKKSKTFPQCDLLKVYREIYNSEETLTKQEYREKDMRLFDIYCQKILTGKKLENIGNVLNRCAFSAYFLLLADYAELHGKNVEIFPLPTLFRNYGDENDGRFENCWNMCINRFKVTKPDLLIVPFFHKDSESCFSSQTMFKGDNFFYSVIDFSNKRLESFSCAIENESLIFKLTSSMLGLIDKLDQYKDIYFRIPDTELLPFTSGVADLAICLSARNRCSSDEISRPVDMKEFRKEMLESLTKKKI